MYVNNVSPCLLFYISLTKGLQILFTNHDYYHYGYTEGVDYSELHRDIYLNVTNTTFCVDVTIFDDLVLENNEQFNLVLTSTDPDIHVLGEMVTVQISDDDCELS